ncbi:MAG: STAS domain-containing protein [Gammaproteobacteria bacterium]|nr:MAG: STAS domain-containing protein [Gammaproteobacteria bacterium]
MNIKARTVKGKCKAKIEGDMTVYTACEMKEKLLQKLAKCQAMELDLSQVVEFDTAGFQLLVLLKREAEHKETPLLMKSHSPAVQDFFELYHVSEQVERDLAGRDHAKTTMGEQSA